MFVPFYKALGTAESVFTLVVGAGQQKPVVLGDAPIRSSAQNRSESEVTESKLSVDAMRS
jgi:hypothetical protein